MRFTPATVIPALLLARTTGASAQGPFDRQSVSSIGDVAIAPDDPNVVWVGVGEPNNRKRWSWGDGIYKTTERPAVIAQVNGFLARLPMLYKQQADAGVFPVLPKPVGAPR